jgi:hypothetical protein
VGEDGQVLDTADMDPLFFQADLVYSEYEKVKTQPPSFLALSLTPALILNNVPENMENFTKVNAPNNITTTSTVNDVEVTRNLEVSFVRADEWVFVNVKILNPQSFEEDEYTYFINFTDLEKTDVYFREANKDCPLPDAKEPLPPVVKKCRWYYSRVEAIYEYYIKITNIQEKGNLLKCICEGILKLTNQPSIELLCLEEAIVDTSHKLLTQEKYDHFMSIYTHAEGNTYNTNHKTEQSVGTVQISDLTDEQIEAFQNKELVDNTIQVDDKVIIEDAIEKTQTNP